MTDVMGIVNRTPDSFYDGGRLDLARSLEYALQLVEEGAAMLDLGGVRAGPGPDVSENEEIDRLLPLVEAVVGASAVPLSVETARPEVARLALDAGARCINDVSGLTDPELAAVCAERHATLILIHHGGQVRGRPLSPRYDDVVRAVLVEWERLAGLARRQGLQDASIVVDPGIDFGKNTFQSLELMRRIREWTDVRWPVLVAASRKDLIGETLGLPPEERLEGSLALVALAVWGGAALVRVHDVGPSVRTVRMVEAVMGITAPAAPVRGLWG